MESLDGWVDGGANLAGEGSPIRVTTCNLTGGLMPALGVSPVAGRLIDSNDDSPGKPLAAVISYGLWQAAFAGDRNISGRETRLNGLPIRSSA